jgi:hypothetical protein
MHFPEINTYIVKFEELARQAGYTMGNSETMRMFIKGLMPSVMEDVLKPPHTWISCDQAKDDRVHLVKSATRQYTQSKTTWWKRVPRRCIPRVSMRRNAETTLLFKTECTESPGTHTKV